MNYSDDFREMIKKYNDEIKQYQKRSKPETIPVQAPVTEPEVVPAQTLTPQQQQEEQIANQFPFTNDYSLPNILDSQIIKGQTNNLTGEGTLIVRVFTSNSASPVEGASVLVSFDGENGEVLVKSMITDRNGETERITLPTVSKQESLSPGIDNPYASYSIRVSAKDYFTIDSVNVPVFDGQEAVQPVEMIPLPEKFEGDIVLKSNDTGSITLN